MHGDAAAVLYNGLFCGGVHRSTSVPLFWKGVMRWILLIVLLVLLVTTVPSWPCQPALGVWTERLSGLPRAHPGGLDVDGQVRTRRKQRTPVRPTPRNDETILGELYPYGRPVIAL